jgi:hypothetical protein
MKRYTTPGQLRLVGKVWEIRQYVRQQMKKTGDMPVKDFLTQRSAGLKPAARRTGRR